MSIFKRTQRKYVKKAYRVRNWREYEAGLRNRGSLTVWISLTAGKLVNWDAPRPRRRKPGRQRKYSNHAIETAVTLGMVFHLSSRQSEGLLRSLFALMKLDNDVPDHTTLSRRKPNLGKVPFYQVKQKTPLHILIDSSGLAVHAGQLRRAQKSRDYRKLHLCVDEQSGEVVAGELTSKRARDSSRVASLVGQIDSPISSARADTAYDAGGVYEAIENHSAHRSPRVLIPPRKGALLTSGPASSRQRNRNIAAQARLGKRKWHTESGYSKRSKVETTFHRYKAIVGSDDPARVLWTSTEARQCAWRRPWENDDAGSSRGSSRRKRSGCSGRGERSIGQVAKELDLTESALRNWVKQYKVDHGEGPREALTTAERDELRSLRRRVRTLEQEREILKKAAAFFAKESE